MLLQLENENAIADSIFGDLLSLGRNSRAFEFQAEELAVVNNYDGESCMIILWRTGPRRDIDHFHATRLTAEDERRFIYIRFA